VLKSVAIFFETETRFSCIQSNRLVWNKV